MNDLLLTYFRIVSRIQLTYGKWEVINRQVWYDHTHQLGSVILCIKIIEIDIGYVVDILTFNKGKICRQLSFTIWTSAQVFG